LVNISRAILHIGKKTNIKMNIEKLKQIASEMKETNFDLFNEIMLGINSYLSIESKLESVKKNENKLENRLAELESKLSQYSALDRYKSELESFEKRIYEKEKIIVKNECDYKVQEAEKRAFLVTDLFKTVFTSDLWKRVIVENKTEVISSRGIGGMDIKEREVKTTTVTAEENKK
jgi:CII-binding regulator of phage lambda lysogenization HflD